MQKPEELEAALEAGSPASLYLLAGPAEYLMERFVRRLAKACGARRVRIDAGTMAPERMATEVLVPDLFAAARVVHVPEAGSWKADARRKLMKEVVAGGLAPGLRLVLCLETTTPPREKIPEACAAAFFWNPFPSALPRLAEAWIRERGAKHGPGVGAKLAELYGFELRRLDQEIAKLVAGSRGDVTLAQVEALCPRLPEGRAFMAAEAITARNPGPAMEVLADVLELEGPHGLVPVLANRLRRMLVIRRCFAADPAGARKVVGLAERLAGNSMMRREERDKLEGEIRTFLERAEDPDELAEIHPRQLPGLVAQAALYTVDELAAGLGRVAEADRKLKGDGEDERLALERVVALLGRPARGAARGRARG